MGTAGLRAVVRDTNYAVHGVPAVLTAPDGFPASCTVIWLSPATEMQPRSGDLRRADARRAMAVRTREVSSLPRGTRISVAEAPGETPEEFVLDSVDKVEHGECRFTVIRRP